MVDLDDGVVKTTPLVSGEVSQLHLPADVDTDGDIQQKEGKLLEVFVILRIVTDLVQSQQVVLTFLLVVQLHEILADFFHPILSISDRLDLNYCLLLSGHIDLLFLFLNLLVLFLILISFLLLLFLLFILFIVCLLSLGSLQPIFPTHHRIR